MLVYLVTIFLTWIFSVYAVKYSTGSGIDIKQRIPSKFFVFMILAVWCTVYALRYYVGTDFVNYYHDYNEIGIQKLSVLKFIETQRDALFGYLSYFCSKVFNGSWVVFSYVCAIITYLPVLIVMRKKSADFVASSLLFIFTMACFSCFNGVRQGIAASIVFLAYYCFLKEKKYWLYALFVFIAFGFHSTAIIIVPFHLLSLLSLKSKIFKITVTVMTISYFVLWSVWSYVIEFFEWIGQEKLANDYADIGQDGSSLIRLLVAAIPVLLGIVYQKTLRKHYQDIDAEVILLCVAAIFTLFSMENWIFSRIASYLQFSLILFLPKLKVVFDKENQKLGRVLILVLYFAYMLILLVRGESDLLPYTFIV